MTKNIIEITISVSNCDKEKEALFIKSITDEKLDAIRNILGEPTATIHYPTLAFKDRFGYEHKAIMTSFIQDYEELKEK
ncbi:hypothetical protein A3Q29_21360 [Providencia stuartii]|uniref:Uncharacterized protein n=1 Tax=Providencia stuartii TaxID=588 RepID=A0A1S1HP59_PROST|nr:hypothetical protein A3Q29_21360 [Providencia stuartii]